MPTGSSQDARVYPRARVGVQGSPAHGTGGAVPPEAQWRSGAMQGPWGARAGQGHAEVSHPTGLRHLDGTWATLGLYPGALSPHAALCRPPVVTEGAPRHLGLRHRWVGHWSPSVHTAGLAPPCPLPQTPQAPCTPSLGTPPCPDTHQPAHLMLTPILGRHDGPGQGLGTGQRPSSWAPPQPDTSPLWLRDPTHQSRHQQG